MSHRAFCILESIDGPVMDLALHKSDGVTAATAV